MTRPKGTLIRNTHRDPDQSLDHRRLLRAADAVGPVDVRSDAVLASGLFGGGQWTRAIHPWIGIVLLISYAGLIVQFWRDNLWNRDDLAWMLAIDRVLANEEEGVPEVGALQRRPEVRVLVDGACWSRCCSSPALLIWEVLFLSLHVDRDAAGRGAHSFAGGDCGDHRLDHPCLCRDLGQRLDAGHDAGLCDAGLGLAASPQMVSRSWRRPAPPDRSRASMPKRTSEGELVRQGGVPPTGKWVGTPHGGVKAPDPLILPDPQRVRRELQPGWRRWPPAIRWQRMAALHGDALRAPSMRGSTHLTLSAPLEQDGDRSGGGRAHAAARCRWASPRSRWRDGLACSSISCRRGERRRSGA